MKSRMIPYMTDEEIALTLLEYDDRGFQDLPPWLQQELQVRKIVFTKREPTEAEQHETKADAREHRLLNNERTLEDFQDQYLHGRNPNIF